MQTLFEWDFRSLSESDASEALVRNATEFAPKAGDTPFMAELLRGIMSLDEFLKWYRKPKWAQDGDTIRDADQYRDGEPIDTSAFYPLVGAPEHLPWRIHQPEILVPNPIPAEHIRLVQ
jgi:hypothetical protein